MNNKNSVFAAIIFLSGLVVSNTLSAEETVPANSTAESPEPVATYTKKGADSCIKCHDEDSDFPVFSIFKTKHAQAEDERTPFAKLQCESCHGPGASHAKKVSRKEKQAPINSFGSRSKLSADGMNPLPASVQNKVCLNCHQGNNHISWKDSVHENADIACASCHKVHAAHDAALSKQDQPDVCFSCHKKERAEFFKTSSHPVRSGLMACNDCHKPHGSGADKLLVKSTVNQTCYTCHAEKRGPFLWEHAPVSEDCTTCHSPHGSVHKALLKKPTAFLCKQCHAVSGHPALSPSGNALPGGSSPSTSAFLLSGSCTNCHSQVHGSNHPSGVKGMR